MKPKKEVIFLIDSKSVDRNILGSTLERAIKCKVFNFFSIKESYLYWGLNPSIVIHDSDEDIPDELSYKADLIHISKNIIRNKDNNRTLNNRLIFKEVSRTIKKVLHNTNVQFTD